HGPGDLGDQPRRTLWVTDVAVQPHGQAGAVDELHAEVVQAVVLADLVDRDDLGVVEVGHRLGLVAESPDLLGAGPGPRPDHLDGDQAVEAELAGLVDDPHAAVAEDPDQLEVAELAAELPSGERASGP